MPIVMSAPPNARLSVLTDSDLEADTHDDNIEEDAPFYLCITD